MDSACVYVTSEHRVEVCGAHASNIAKRGAALVVVAQVWASPRGVSVGFDIIGVVPGVGNVVSGGWPTFGFIRRHHHE
jgi:hypothetical protein